MKNICTFARADNVFVVCMSMFSVIKSISSFLSGKASIFIILTALVAFFLPELFSWVVGDVQTSILGIIMLTMGLTLTVDDFRVLLMRPADILVGTVAQFTIMPIVAYLLSSLVSEIPGCESYANPVAVGVILVGCCPGGVSSNIMSFLCHGDVAYSVGMTCASTLLAPVMTPLLVFYLAGERVDVDALGMFRQILIVTIIPISIGFVLNLLASRAKLSDTAMSRKTVRFFDSLKMICPGISVVCLAFIVGGVVSAVHNQLLENGLIFFFVTFTIVFLHNASGYALGYIVGCLFSFSTAKRRTISIEVGMQNAGLGTNLAMTFFVATNPLAVIPCAVACAWHSISGTILANVFSWMDNKK